MRGPARLVRGNRAGLVERAIAVGIAVMHVNAGVRIDDVVVDQIRRGRFEGHEPTDGADLRRGAIAVGPNAGRRDADANELCGGAGRKADEAEGEDERSANRHQGPPVWMRQRIPHPMPRGSY